MSQQPHASPLWVRVVIRQEGVSCLLRLVHPDALKPYQDWWAKYNAYATLEVHENDSPHWKWEW